MTRAEKARIFDELSTLVAIEGTSGDEALVADRIAEWIAPLPAIQSRRIQDNLIVWRGQPQVALSRTWTQSGLPWVMTAR